jgi:hypothetical protein
MMPEHLARALVMNPSRVLPAPYDVLLQRVLLLNALTGSQTSASQRGSSGGVGSTTNPSSMVADGGLVEEARATLSALIRTPPVVVQGCEGWVMVGKAVVADVHARPYIQLQRIQWKRRFLELSGQALLIWRPKSVIIRRGAERMEKVCLQYSHY